MEKPFKVAYVVKTKHGDLFKAMTDRGWTQKQVAEFLGISQQDIGRILNLNGKPPKFSKQKGGAARFKHFKQRLLDLTGKTFEDLFPDEVFNDDVMEKARPVNFFIEKDLATLKLEPSSGVEVLTLPESADANVHYDEVIPTIQRLVTFREWTAIEAHFLKDKSFDEIGRVLNVSRSRVGQIIKRALRRLRSHPHILHILVGDEDTDLMRTLGVEKLSSLIKPAESSLSRVV